MNSTEKRIDKLKQEKKKVDENISKLKKKSADISGQIESLENEKIVTAFRSSGLKMAGRAARLMVPSAFMASLPTLRVSGTCFANTTIFKLMLFD